MRLLLLLAATCACNQVFGLHDPVVVDAQQFDGIDAPYQCPPIGMVPQFSTVVTQLHEDCGEYTASTTTGFAVALCSYEDGAQIAQGPMDGPFAPSAGVPQYTGDITVNGARLSPEGDLLFVSTFDITTAVSDTGIYQAQPDGSWVHTADLPVGNEIASTPSRGPDRHLLATPSLTEIDEWADGGTGTWTQVAVHTAASLGVVELGATWLSPDGLRMIVVTNSGHQDTSLAYADRAHFGDPFSPASPLAVPSSNAAAFMTEDCGRFYVSGLESIFFEHQE